MPALREYRFASILGILTLVCAAQAEDLHLKKTISISGNQVSSSEVWVKGARERSLTSSPTGKMITLRQCDLKRTLMINEQTQSYFVTRDPDDGSVAKAAAMFGGAPVPAGSSGGTVTETTTVTDTGERKQLSGYTARRLKTTVLVESSPNSCSKINQKFAINGWYADIAKEQSSCGQSLPPVHQEETCSDRVIVHHKGTAKAGYPLVETITMQAEDSTTTNIEVLTSDISKQTLTADLFDVPTGFREVKSMAELFGVPQLTAPAGNPPIAGSAAPSPGLPGQTGVIAQNQQTATMQRAISAGSQFQQAMPGMAGIQGQVTSAAVPLPQALGPKAPGKIRIGIAPAQAQLGQGNNAQADYATPIRNAMVYMMNGPAVEIAALDSRIPLQLQAEAQQKQCDFILLSSVTVQHSGGKFGKFMKAGNMAASMNPMVMMTKSVSAMAASQAASQAAAMTAQQQAVNQLSQFNGQIKSKDDVTVDYQLYPTGQGQPKLQNSLKGKAKSDGEDVLTPLIQQAASTILTDVTKK
jgi:hypothetical protein